MSTVRCMLNVSICNNWDLFQLDINNAFMYGDLSEDVYMTLPLGFDNDKSKVCKLNKSLYGLKQAPKQWNAKLTKALTEHGFARYLHTRDLSQGHLLVFSRVILLSSTWKTKKQSTLSRSYIEAEYRSMTSATCEVIWLSNLLGDMGVENLFPVVMYCDNNSALQIAANPMVHEKSKHFEIDVHLVWILSNIKCCVENLEC
ncbi:ribonuclease H-like domain-containing protein [Tanacetum coccineum]